MSGTPFQMPEIPEAAKTGALKTLADGTMFAFAMQAKLKHETIPGQDVRRFLGSFQKEHPKAVLVGIVAGAFFEPAGTGYLVVYYELDE